MKQTFLTKYKYLINEFYYDLGFQISKKNEII